MSRLRIRVVLLNVCHLEFSYFSSWAEAEIKGVESSCK